MGTSATRTGPVVLAGAQNMIPQSMALWSVEYADWRSESFRSKAVWPSTIPLPLTHRSQNSSYFQPQELELLCNSHPSQL